MKNNLITGKKICFMVAGVMTMALLACGCAKSTSKDSSQESIKATESNSQTTATGSENVSESAQATNSASKMNKVGLYIHGEESGTHELVTKYVSNWEKGKDIECFEAFTTHEQKISGSTFRNTWEPYWYSCSDADQYKIGYCLSFTLKNGDVCTKTIKSPSDTKEYFDYIELYIYDDVHQTPGVWYTHLSESDVNADTFMTSIKLTAGSKIAEVKDIKLTAFVYISDKDFDSATGKYTGNNSYEISVSRSE